MSTLGYYWQAWKRHPWTGAASIGFIALGTCLLDVLMPYLASRVMQILSDIDHGHRHHDQWHWWVLMVATGALGIILWRIGMRLTVRRQPRMLHYLETMVFNRLTLHSEAFFQNRFSGSLVSQTKRFVSGYERLEDLMSFQVNQMMVRSVSSFIVLLIVLPAVGVALMGFFLFFVGSVGFLSWRKQYLGVEASKKESGSTGLLADVTSNMLNVKSFAGREKEAAAYKEASTQHRLKQREWWLSFDAIGIYQMVLVVSMELTIMYLSIKGVENGAALATALLAQLYTGRIIGDLYGVAGMTRIVSQAFGESKEMTEILNLPIDITDVDNAQQLEVAHGGIHFDHIDFSWNPEAPVFNDFDLEIAPGERVGLVGRSGSGKSTLIRLLLRLVEPNSGEVRIDGQNTAVVTQDSLRSNITYVSQEPVLFHRSLFDNIAYSRPDATLEQVRAAAQAAHADEFISELPDGYETLVGERGVKLSGGERQRVAIARAILNQAHILVLDEATSALDSMSERLVVHALDGLMEGKTTLVIAHRLSTIASMDRIIVLDNGRIVEQGSHYDLLQKNGMYATMWQHQTGGMIGDEPSAIGD